tara:strand:- start:614 stop:817 length:204 start_codon:yes stop_codon:yes gene_type:complete
MSWVSGYVRREIRRRGVTGFITRILEMMARFTPSKKDDAMVADIIEFVDNYAPKKKAKAKAKSKDKE